MMLMLIIFHILSATLGIIVSFYGAFAPSGRKIKASAVFTLLTIITGGALVAVTGAQLTSVCLSGLLYLGIVLPLMAVGKRRLQVT